MNHTQTREFVLIVASAGAVALLWYDNWKAAGVLFAACLIALACRKPA